MDNITIDVKTKQVGNSLALFIPMDAREQINLGPNEEVIAHIHKKKAKNKKEILSLFGILKGKKISWKCSEDRLDEDLE